MSLLIFSLQFAYGLANGTVGVYSTPKSRLWRVKTKNKVTALHTYDLDLDGERPFYVHVMPVCMCMCV